MRRQKQNQTTDIFLNQIAAGIIYLMVALFAYQFFGSSIIILYMRNIFWGILIVSAALSVWCMIRWNRNKTKILPKFWSMHIFGVTLLSIWILAAKETYKSTKYSLVFVAAYFLVVTALYIFNSARKRQKTRR